MSSPASEQPAAKTGGLKQHLPFVIALVAGLAAGGASGAFFVGPAMAKGIAPGGAPVAHAPAADDEEASAEEEGEGESEGGGHGGEKKEGEKGGEKPVHTIDNLVLNPAESGGTRFLLLTVTFEAKSAGVVDQMKARDAELRDAVLVTIGRKTVDQLADMTQRETLKAELSAAAAKLFKAGAVRRVYFPQFVIQ